jgi:hypothetical protein
MPPPPAFDPPYRSLSPKRQANKNFPVENNLKNTMKAIAGILTALPEKQKERVIRYSIPEQILPYCLNQFNWSFHILMPPNASPHDLPEHPHGLQVHKFGTDNRKYSKVKDYAEEYVNFVKSMFGTAFALQSDSHIQILAAFLARANFVTEHKNGVVIDFGAGVYKSAFVAFDSWVLAVQYNYLIKYF